MTRKLAFSSIMTALAIVCLFGSVALPTGKIALLALTSMCVLVTVAECGTHFALVCYGATVLVGFLLVPFKAQILIFTAFIGYYPIVKCYIERIGKLYLEWLVKILFFTSILILAYFTLKYALLPYISFGAVFDYVFSNLLLVAAIAELVFILYDYILSLFASYYVSVIQKRLYPR